MTTTTREDTVTDRDGTQVLSSGPEYDYLVVRTNPVRFTYFQSVVEITAWSSAPEYGAGRVQGNGFKVRKDGTRGNQIVKPILNYGSCPAAVRAEFTKLGYTGKGAL